MRVSVTCALLLIFTQCVTAADRIHPPATQPSGLEKGGWELTFHDEFDGSALDATKWSDHYWHGRTHANHELEYYASDTVDVKDGLLRLTAREVPPERRKETTGLPYASGMIEGSGKFAQQYGWFEMRAKLPAGKGYWPAFWLLPATRKWPPEIDILEVLGHEPDVAYFTTHWRTEGRRLDSDGHKWKGPDLSADFHTYAVDWEPGLVVYYVDGVERARGTKGVPAEPMYVIVNLAIGGDWPGNPDATTKFPQTMLVDYVRVYRKSVTGK